MNIHVVLVSHYCVCKLGLFPFVGFGLATLWLLYQYLLLNPCMNAKKSWVRWSLVNAVSEWKVTWVNLHWNEWYSEKGKVIHSGMDDPGLLFFNLCLSWGIWLGLAVASGKTLSVFAEGLRRREWLAEYNWNIIGLYAWAIGYATRMIFLESVGVLNG